MNQIQPISIVFFLAFFAVTVLITIWATKRNKSANQYLVASGGISSWQNGLAMSGEFMSASALLGMTGLVATLGYGSYVYSVASVVIWPLILGLLADPIRRLGRFTLTDVIVYRLRERPVRIAAVAASIPITLLYLIGQMVAGGALIKLLFGIPYAPAVIFVGIITLSYVLFGGMLATTWVQIIKAALMHLCVIVLTILVLAQFDFNPAGIFRSLQEQGMGNSLFPSELSSIGKWDIISLAMAIVLGGMGMPQVLTRFFTVPDPLSARKSSAYATAIVGTFHLMVLIVAFGAMALIGKEAILAAGGGGNMAVPLLAHKLGGDTFFGIICGVAFATVIAVIAGLTLASATSFAHDVWARVYKANDGNEEQHASLKVARIGAFVVAVIATLLALLFQNMNVAFLIGLSQAISAATNFPLLMMALFWRKFTTRGAVAAVTVGVISSLVLIILSPTVQVSLLGGSKEILMTKWWYFPLNSPAVVCVPLALFVGVVASLMRKEPTAEVKFDEMQAQFDSNKNQTYATDH